ncbi:glutathione S-transferase family protein [Luteimonas sp. 100069]|uniref:glutathione S-transferase family protein n=1 Tax=Luteimonas sp. 100069 TaxID=2006109 RepID=UPI0018F5ECDD|nr:glutathione S-transferase family protein [Luteimonas sp. 100069]
MKIYMHPISTTSRPVRLFAAEIQLTMEEEVVDILAGAQHQEPFVSINPNRLIPMLEDGDLRLTESVSILRYLAEKSGSPAYPSDPEERARVNEMLDWLNSNFYRDFGYGLVYPQVVPYHRRQTEQAQAATLAWAKDKSEVWLRRLEDHWLAHGKPHLCASGLTIADYFGACVVTLGEVIGCEYTSYPRVQRWLEHMKALPNWESVNEAFDSLKNEYSTHEFVSIRNA